MITRTWTPKDISEAMFPVIEQNICLDTPYGRSTRIPGYHAIVDAERGKTLSVVTDNYKLILNKEAYELADLIIRGVFTDRTIHDFVCYNVRVSRSRGSCIIDLIIPNNFEEIFGNPNESWTPFLRITNSYNRRSVLRYEVGFCRWICLNGCIFGQKSFTISIRHDELYSNNDYQKVIREARDKMGSIDSIWKTIIRRLEALRAIEISQLMVLPLYCKIFGIRIDKEKLTDAQKDKLAVRAGQILKSSKEYFAEMGSNAYALFNVMTDYASFPADISNGSVTIHNLQHRVGLWVDEFIEAHGKEGFSLSKYIGEEAMDAAFYMEMLIKQPVEVS